MPEKLHPDANPNKQRKYELAAMRATEVFCSNLPEEVGSFLPGTTVDCINKDEVPALTDAVLDLIAHIVASIIDAGSERDAVNEDEELHKAIKDQLAGWSNDPDRRDLPPIDPPESDAIAGLTVVPTPLGGYTLTLDLPGEDQSQVYLCDEKETTEVAFRELIECRFDSTDG